MTATEQTAKPATKPAYVETFECAGCQAQMRERPDWTVTRDTTFCDSCWQSMTPFQRGLMRTLIDAADRIRGTIEEAVTEVTAAIEGISRQ